MTTITPDQIAEIAARADAVPAEAWEAVPQIGVPGHAHLAQVFGPTGSRIVVEPTDNPDEASAIADFIAHARTDIPALLAHVHALEARTAPDAMIAACDAVIRAVDNVLTAQPHQMTRRATELEAARGAMKDQLLALARRGARP